MIASMTYEQVKNLKPEDCNRLFGVRTETFNQMVEVVHSFWLSKKKTERPGFLSLSDQVLMTLEYYTRSPVGKLTTCYSNPRIILCLLLDANRSSANDHN